MARLADSMVPEQQSCMSVDAFSPPVMIAAALASVGKLSASRTRLRTMTEIVLFHHAQGLTDGVRAFADDLRAAGHVVHTPDFFDGRTFDDLGAGIAHAESIGFDNLVAQGEALAGELPEALVYVGMSLGGMSAQKLAMTRPGALGAVLLHTAVPLEYFGGAWPDGVPGQIHTAKDDDWGDADVAEAIAAEVPSVELFLYPGDQHLFTDRSLPAYDEQAAGEVLARVLSFLGGLH